MRQYPANLPSHTKAEWMTCIHSTISSNYCYITMSIFIIRIENIYRGISEHINIDNKQKQSISLLIALIDCYYYYYSLKKNHFDLLLHLHYRIAAVSPQQMLYKHVNLLKKYILIFNAMHPTLQKIDHTIVCFVHINLDKSSIVRIWKLEEIMWYLRMYAHVWVSLSANYNKYTHVSINRRRTVNFHIV